MDQETSALLDSSSASTAAAGGSSDPNHGWQKVTYPKRHRKQAAADPSPAAGNQKDSKSGSSNVFASVEQKANERYRAIQSANGVSVQPAVLPRGGSDEEDSDEEAARGKENVQAEALKKPKVKKEKKPKVTVAEAAAKIDVNDLAGHLADISVSYEDKQDIQLMRFADYFGRAFSTVSASQFPWVKIFKESPISKILDMPMNQISDPVYKTAADWVAQKSQEALGDFVIWCMDIILADLASQLPASKGPKKASQTTPSRSQVAMFVVLAMTLRRKPETLITLLPKIKENPKYQGAERLPFVIWVVGQASLGDLVVGTYVWARYLFPTVCGKVTGGNPQSRDLVLQLIERILAAPKSKSILSNGAVRKGERLIPPFSFDLLMRATFPPSNARVKASERFEAIYPTMKELALAGAPNTKTTKQASIQLLPSCVKAMQEKNNELAKEASDVFIWCLAQNTECYKQWNELHMGNLEASVIILKKLSTEWKEISPKLNLDSLKITVSQIKSKTEEALTESNDPAKQGLLKEADKLCKGILGKVKKGHGCLKGSLVIFLAASVAAGFVMTNPDFNLEEYLDLKKLQTMFTAYSSSF
ncbi:hypothetical protein LUZ60_009909 [Juncus effusus]|nr:hypothetical protein LUZ60_009909 [Juncus effusus]